MRGDVDAGRVIHALGAAPGVRALARPHPTTGATDGYPDTVFAGHHGDLRRYSPKSRGLWPPLTPA